MVLCETFKTMRKFRIHIEGEEPQTIEAKTMEPVVKDGKLSVKFTGPKRVVENVVIAFELIPQKDFK